MLKEQIHTNKFMKTNPISHIKTNPQNKSIKTD